MGKLLGGVFILGAVACGVLFVSTAFMHGYASGMRRLWSEPEHFLFAGGTVVCLAVGILSLVRKPGGKSPGV